MFCDSQFRLSLIEMAPGDTTVGSGPICRLALRYADLAQRSAWLPQSPPPNPADGVIRGATLTCPARGCRAG